MVKKRRFWTDEEVAILIKRYPDELASKIAEDLGISLQRVYGKVYKLRLKKSESFRQSDLSGRIKAKRRFSPATEFKKGQTPWNKGKKMPYNANSAATQFKKGNKPHNWKPIGSTRITKDGYLQVKVTDTGRPPKDWVGSHVILYEQHFGKVPKGFAVVFKDGDKRNITIENLEMIHRTELMKRNTVANYPPEIVQAHMLRGALTRQINRRLKNESKKETERES